MNFSEVEIIYPTESYEDYLIKQKRKRTFPGIVIILFIFGKTFTLGYRKKNILEYISQKDYRKNIEQLRNLNILHCSITYNILYIQAEDNQHAVINIKLNMDFFSVLERTDIKHIMIDFQNRQIIIPYQGDN